MARSSSAQARAVPELGAWSRALHDLLLRFTAFPWALMTTVCQRHGCDPYDLTRSEIEALIGAFALGVASFNDVDDGFRLKRELLVMLRTGTSR
jgi:hypothetical protein